MKETTINRYDDLIRLGDDMLKRKTKENKKSKTKIPDNLIEELLDKCSKENEKSSSELIVNDMLEKGLRKKIIALKETDLKRCQKYINNLNKIYKDEKYDFKITTKGKIIGNNKQKRSNKAEKSIKENKNNNANEIDNNNSYENNSSSTKKYKIKGKEIANYFIVPKFIIHNYYSDKYEELIYLEVYLLKYKECTCLILEKNEINDATWISKYLDKNYFTLFESKKVIINILRISMQYKKNRDICKINNNGWTNIDGKWEYNKLNCRSVCSERLSKKCISINKYRAPLKTSNFL